MKKNTLTYIFAFLFYFFIEPFILYFRFVFEHDQHCGSTMSFHRPKEWEAHIIYPSFLT